MILLRLELIPQTSIIRFYFLQNQPRSKETSVGIICTLVIDVLMTSFLQLFIVDINDPVGRPIGETSICTFKNFLLSHFAHSLIVEFSPFVVSMVFNEVEVVTTIGVSLVNTNCMNMICLLLLLNIFEDRINFSFLTYLNILS